MYNILSYLCLSNHTYIMRNFVNTAFKLWKNGVKYYNELIIICYYKYQTINTFIILLITLWVITYKFIISIKYYWIVYNVILMILWQKNMQKNVKQAIWMLI